MKASNTQFWKKKIGNVYNVKTNVENLFHFQVTMFCCISSIQIELNNGRQASFRRLNIGKHKKKYQ